MRLPSYDIAIIGGGFAGIACAHALRSLDGHSQIAIFDPSPSLPAGTAFAAAQDQHLLNVPAWNMSLSDQRPNDFVDYCAKCLGSSADSFSERYLPRRFYAQYLASHVAALHVNHGREYVRDIRPAQEHWQIYANGEIASAKQVILALGNVAPRQALVHPHWYVGPWSLQSLPSHQPDDVAVIVGSGLTAVDSVLSLLNLGWRGAIRMISRHAKLPAEHVPQTLPDWQFANQFLAQAQQSPRHLLAQLRCELASAAKSKTDWRAVLQALRPITSTIFATWTEPQRRKMIKRLLWLWTPVRHRMAAEVSMQMTKAQASGQLTLHADTFVRADVADTAEHAQATDIDCVFKQQRVRAKLVIDARSLTPVPAHYPLLMALHSQALIALHADYPRCTAEGLCAKQGEAAIYALGPMRYGELLETTAVPEIRAQANLIAQAIYARR